MQDAMPDSPVFLRLAANVIGQARGASKSNESFGRPSRSRIANTPKPPRQARNAGAAFKNHRDVTDTDTYVSIDTFV